MAAYAAERRKYRLWNLGEFQQQRLQFREICRVAWLCVAWYAVSSGNNVVGKTLLTDFQYPMTVTMAQLLTNAALSGPLFAFWGVRPCVDISWTYYMKIIVPLALGKFISSVMSHVSLWKVPVSYAHTVKGTMPLFTVVLSRIILGEKQTAMVYLSLAPIICGVLIATVTEISFDMIGLISALISTLGFSVQNIFSKKVLKDTGVHHLRLLHLLAKLALFMFLPVWLLYDFRHIVTGEIVSNNGDGFLSLSLLVADGLLNFAQNIIAFSILNLVTPLTYSVCNATKRISVIVVSLIMLRNPVTITNMFGMLLAIVGVLGYNKAKYDANCAKLNQPILPTKMTPSSNDLFLSEMPLHVNLTANGAQSHYSNGDVGPRWS